MNRPSVPLLRLVPCLAVALAAVALQATGAGQTAILAAATLVIACGLLLDVDLPWGGSVSLGHALVIALAVLTDPIAAVAVTAASIAVVAPVRWRVDLGHVAFAAAAAVAADAAFQLIPIRGLDADVRILTEVAVSGAAFLGVDLAIGRRRVRQVWPLYVTLLCAAALLAVAYERSAALALVAGVPLLVTKYSFERFAHARRAYAQTTQALSLLPEVAGLTPLGHGERTGVYAEALAAELGYDATAIERIATAARLHHIGYISLHEPEARTGPPDLFELGRLSGDLLRETGFLVDIAALVEQAQTGGVRQLEAAIIRVCSTLDDLAGGEGEVDDPFAGVLIRHTEGLERTAAVGLLRVQQHRPDLVDQARAASRILALVAAGEGRLHDHSQPGAGDEPHDCR